MKTTIDSSISVQAKLIFDQLIFRCAINPFNNSKGIALSVVFYLFFYQLAASTNAATPVKSAPHAITISVDGLEIIQAVQGPDNSVPMIANKPTIVRAYLTIQSPDLAIVRGELKITSVSGTSVIVPSTNTIRLDPAITYSMVSKRENIDSSLNFRVPPELLSSSRLTFVISSIIDAASGSVLACSDCSVKQTSIEFHQTPPLRVRVIGIRYKTNEEIPKTHEPAPEDFKKIESWLRRAYPVANVEFSQTIMDAKIMRTGEIYDDKWPFDCNQINAQLSSIRAEDISNRSIDPRTHYYGLVWDGNLYVKGLDNKVEGPFFMRGCSPVAEAANPSTVASGATGNYDWGWDFDGSYGDWYAGHELAHTLGRSHPGFCGDQVREDKEFAHDDGRISDLTPYFMGMDINGTSIYPLPGSTWHDVMTYCPQQWLSKHTYCALLDRLVAEEVFATQAIPARSAIAREFRASASRFTAAMRANAIDASPQVSTPDAQSADSVKAQFVEDDLIHVVAIINYSQKKIESMNRPTRISRGIISYQKDEAKIRLFDANDKLLAEYPASVKLSTDPVEKQDQKALVSTLVPFVRGTAKVVLLYGETEAQQTVSEKPPTTTKPSNQGGASLSGGSAMQFAWKKSTDPDGDQLTYTVEISSNNKVWEVCATDLTVTSWKLSPETIKEKLKDSRNVWIRVVTSDGFNRAIGPSLKIR
jgi:hypothetical protein